MTTNRLQLFADLPSHCSNQGWIPGAGKPYSLRKRGTSLTHIAAEALLVHDSGNSLPGMFPDKVLNLIRYETSIHRRQSPGSS
jgi:hypothetical protein